MTTLSQTLRTKSGKALLAAVALLVLLPPAGVLAAERRDRALFLAGGPPTLSHSSPYSLPSFLQLSPSFARLEQPEAERQNGPLERNSRWGNSLGSMAIPALGPTPCVATKV
jgi:hypothetical protein